MKRRRYFSDMNPFLDGMGAAAFMLPTPLWAENFYLWCVVFGDVK